jgi:hypothetical protein
MKPHTQAIKVMTLVRKMIISLGTYKSSDKNLSDSLSLLPYQSAIITLSSASTALLDNAHAYPYELFRIVDDRAGYHCAAESKTRECF